jgi:hypothetical protein
MLPSFYKSGESDRAWNVAHAARFGAAIGAIAALFKIFGPFRLGAGSGYLSDNLIEIVLAAAAFAALCAGAAALRNYIARRLVWHEGNGR